MGQIARCSGASTKDEKRLLQLRDKLAYWEHSGYGLQYPADSATRLSLGCEIAALKMALVESGLYRVVVPSTRES